MKIINDKELIELDAWIAEHVMGTKYLVGLKKRGNWYRPNAHGYTDQQSEAWQLTRDEAKKHEYLHGDEPVTVCEEKCAEKCTVTIEIDSSHTMVARLTPRGEEDYCKVAKTLPLAICIFAKQIFYGNTTNQTK